MSFWLGKPDQVQKYRMHWSLCVMRKRISFVIVPTCESTVFPFVPWVLCLRLTCCENENKKWISPATTQNQQQDRLSKEQTKIVKVQKNLLNIADTWLWACFWHLEVTANRERLLFRQERAKAGKRNQGRSVSPLTRTKHIFSSTLNTHLWSVFGLQKWETPASHTPSQTCSTTWPCSSSLTGRTTCSTPISWSDRPNLSADGSDDHAQ